MAAPPKQCLLTRQNHLQQTGLALLGIIFLIGLAATTYVLYSRSSDEMKIGRERITIQALSTAKSALISWAVSNPNQPGMLPYPDRNGDGNYDGNSDCSTVAFNYSFLLGKLPWRAADDANCATLVSGMGSDLKDGNEQSLWYVVSRNLVYDYPNAEYPVINPGMINAPNIATAPYQRQGGSTAYPWLTVYDKNGRLISDRVAVIIIAPGAAIGDQDRSATAPNATEYLDSFTLAAGGGAKSNRTYAFPDEDFYMGEDARNISSTDTTYVHPYEFNDKLIYITIDELIAAVENRAAAEAKHALQTYHVKNGYYPYPAQLGTPQNYSCEQNPTGTGGLAGGFLPVTYQNCIYTASPANISCSQPIFDTATSSVTQVRFRLNGGDTFLPSSPSGSCVLGSSETECRCTGTGNCSRTSAPTLTVSCTTYGCSAVGAATGYFQIRGGKFTYRSGGCTDITPAPVFPTKDSSGCTDSTTSRVTCDAVSGNGSFASCGDARFDTPDYLPNWFTSNKWHDYIFYARSPSITRSSSMISGTSTITTTTAGISPGWSVSGRGIPTVSSGTPINVTVQSITNATTLVLSNAVTYSGTVPLVFSPIATNRSTLATSQPSTTTAGSPNISTSGNFASVYSGWLVEGTGIPLGTTVASKTSNTALVLSKSATISGTATLRFSPLNISQSCTRGAGSTTLTTTGVFDSILAGWAVSGTGIQAGTTVASWTDSSTLVLSKTSTASGTSILTFTPPFSVGTISGVQSLLITTGKPVVATSKGSMQTRPSCSAKNEYLDSLENADDDTIYDETSMPRNSSYNDHTLIVAP